MADEGKPRFDIPWATLLPLLAALAGVLAQFRPLVSARPNIPSGKPIAYTAIQDVDARLWQDPMAAAGKAKERLDADRLSIGVATSRMERHTLDALVETVCQEAAERPTMLLAVMLDAGPYIEQEEARLRAREAVLEGLNASGFVPNDSEHIGFVTIPGEMSPRWEKPVEKIEDGAILIPWEECRTSENSKAVFVLWLPSSSFGDQPLASLAQKVIAPFREVISHDLDLVLLGPANSTGLQKMVNENADPKANADRYRALDGMRIISPRATAPDDELMKDGKKVEDVISGFLPDGHLSFRRTVLTDDEILNTLIDELKRRHVDVSSGRDEKRHWHDGDRVAVFTEWDSPYGRSFAKAFAKKTSDNPRVQFYRYMHGIDGRLPGDPAKSADTSAKPVITQAAAATEATEGVDRSDFLRRLAKDLKEQDRRAWRMGEPGLRAIGLLGSDIFDKLMILRALRPEFPDAIYFTNNYDAHFERKEDWNDVANLVVVSPFGGTIEPFEADSFLPESFRFHQHVAPFRDTNQTSMFFGTLVATGRVTEAMIEEECCREPRIFEIGRHGAQPLYQKERVALDPASAWENSHWFAQWLGSPGVRTELAFGAGALFLLAAWVGLSVVDRRHAGGGGWRDRSLRLASSTAFWLICLVPAIVFYVAWYSQRGDAIEEPLAFFSGISIWPTEMIRLIAFALAIHFMLKAHFDLRRNEHEINRHFFGGKVPHLRWHWRLGLRRWRKEHGPWLEDEGKFSAWDVWVAYLRRNHTWARVIRITALFVVYFVFSLALYNLFPQPSPPARGDVAFAVDKKTLWPAAIALMFLTFYVVDALRLTSNFIRIFIRGVTDWEPVYSRTTGRTPPLTRDELARYHNIFFVAERTAAVAPLIWYPLIVLTLMIIARSPYFDHWTWPLSLLLIFTLNALWALGSAIFLRRSAEHLRTAAINNLQLLRVKSYAHPSKRQMFDELIAEVRNVRKGAFAPLSEQPFIRAILYPSGGLGLLAVGQRFLDIF